MCCCKFYGENFVAAWMNCYVDLSKIVTKTKLIILYKILKFSHPKLCVCVHVGDCVPLSVTFCFYITYNERF